MSTLYERCQKVMPPAAGRSTKLGIRSGKGCYLTAEDGKTYLDFASGVAVCSTGHNHPKVVEAAKKQVDELIHGGHNVVYYESYVRLAERLVELTGGDTMVYFSNSGGEANDGALKLAKHYTKRPAVIVFKNAFHGRTLGNVSITSSNSLYRQYYEGLMPSVYFAEYPYLYRSPYKEEGYQPYLDKLEEMFHTLVDPSMVAAIMMEPVQGEGGYIVPPVGFVQEIRKICDKYGILLIFDEVQSGMGRTGKLFAYEHFGIRPDILSCAKGIASGFPLSAVIARKEIMETWNAGAHGGTFGGNPVSCAAALATLEVLVEGGAIENAAEMGDYFIDKVRSMQVRHPEIGDVRGLGLMIGMEIVDKEGKPDKQRTGEIVGKALEKGLIILTCGTNKNVIRFMPPLIVTKEEIDKALEIVESCF